MSVVRNIANWIAAMYLGRVVKFGRTLDIFENTLHPYTKAILSAVPVMTKKEQPMLPTEVILEGEIPSPENIPVTYPFISRCIEKKNTCEQKRCPELKEVGNGYFVRCILY